MPEYDDSIGNLLSQSFSLPVANRTIPVARGVTIRAGLGGHTALLPTLSAILVWFHVTVKRGCCNTLLRAGTCPALFFVLVAYSSHAHWGYTRAQREEESMAQKVIEIVGSSKESFAKAAENAVAEAAKTCAA